MGKYLILLCLFIISCSGSNHKNVIEENIDKQANITPKNNKTYEDNLIDLFELLNLNPNDFGVVKLPPPNETTNNIKEEIVWKNINKESISDAKKTNKFLFIYFHADFCGFCDLMEKTTFQDKKIVELLNAKFTPIKIDGIENIEVMKEIMGENNMAFPGFAFITPDANILSVFTGYVSPNNLTEMLEYMVKKEKTHKNN